MILVTNNLLGVCKSPFQKTFRNHIFQLVKNGYISDSIQQCINVKQCDIHKKNRPFKVKRIEAQKPLPNVYTNIQQLPVSNDLARQVELLDFQQRHVEKDVLRSYLQDGYQQILHNNMHVPNSQYITEKNFEVFYKVNDDDSGNYVRYSKIDMNANLDL